MLVAVFAFFSNLPEVSGQIRGSTEFQYGTTNTGGGDTFGQRYFLNYGATLSEVLSYNLNFNTTFDSDRGQRTTRTISPSIFLNMDAQDLSAGLGFTVRETEDRSGKTLTSEALFLTLEPHLLEDYIQYSGSYSRRRSYDDISPRRTNVTSDEWRFTMKHVLPLPLLHETRFSYNFNQDMSINNLTRFKQRGLRGTLGVQFSRGFSDKINIAGGVNLLGDKTIFSTPQPPFLQTFTPFGLWSLDLTPTTGSMGNRPALVDGDRDTSAAISLRNLHNNVGADLGGTRVTGLVYIYMVPGFFDFDQEVQWEVYSSGDGENWTLVTTNPDIFFNIAESRYEIGFTEQSTNFIKVVNTTVSSEPNADITEIEVLEKITGLKEIRETTVKALESDLNFSYRVRDDLSLNWSVFYDVEQSAPQEREDVTTLLNGSLAYSPSKYFRLNLGANRSGSKSFSPRERSSGDTSSYGMTLTTMLLDIARPSVSLRLTERQEKDVFLSRTMSGAANLSFLKEIYPGVGFDISGNITQSENFNPESVSLSYGTNLQLNLRPKDWITLTNSYSLSWSRSDAAFGASGLSKSESAASNLSFTPSSFFHISGDFDWTGGDFLSSLNITWLQTPKLQISTTYSARVTDDTSSDLGITLSWEIRNSVTLRAGWSFNFEPGTTETPRNFNLSLFAHF